VTASGRDPTLTAESKDAPERSGKKKDGAQDDERPKDREHNAEQDEDQAGRDEPGGSQLLPRCRHLIVHHNHLGPVTER
jgi:hypothetical protein